MSDSEKRTTHRITPRIAAAAQARMGNAEEAVHWLREAAATGFPCYALFEADPNLIDPPGSSVPTFMAEAQKASITLRLALFPDVQ